MDGVLKHMKSFGLSQEDPQVQKCGGENKIHADPSLPEKWTLNRCICVCLCLQAAFILVCILLAVRPLSCNSQPAIE